MELNKSLEFMNLREGDKIECTDGEQFIFVQKKRVNFTATRIKDGKPYSIPNTMFEKVIEKAAEGPKKINQSYKSLKPGELFLIQNGAKKESRIFKFLEMKNGKIIGEDPVFPQVGTMRIDIELYRGRVSEI